ncbi:hypothetical protein LINGRAHAP2_LOCUS28792 [Linum grandiflorum]
MWTCIASNLSTQDNLKKRGWIIANRCYLCEKSEKSAFHLLVSCPLTYKVWYHFLFAARLNLAFPGDLRALICSWNVSHTDFHRFLKYLPHAIFWAIWLERNERLFRDSASDFKKLVNKIASWLVSGFSRRT